MAQHKRRRAMRYRKHIIANPDALALATSTPEMRKAHRAALAGRSSNAYLRRIGLQ